MGLESVLRSDLNADNFCDLILQISSSAANTGNDLRKNQIKLLRDILKVDIPASITPNLETVLAIDNKSGAYDIVMNDSSYVKALTGGGQLTLNDGSNTATFTNDNNGQGDSGVYLSQGYTSIFSNGWWAAVDLGQLSGDDSYIAAYTSKVQLLLVDDMSGLGMSSGGVIIGDTASWGLTTGSTPNLGVIIGNGSNINQNITDTVVIGSGIEATQNGTVYVSKLSIKTLNGTPASTLLAIDSNGYVVDGSTLVSGATGTFTTSDAKTVTVSNGRITSIV